MSTYWIKGYKESKISHLFVNTCRLFQLLLLTHGLDTDHASPDHDE